MNMTSEKNEFSVTVPIEQISLTKICFPIVGNGASEVGLEALVPISQNEHVNNRLAFVVIQHPDPNHACIMPEFLQLTPQMKMFLATDHLKVMPNHVYVS